MDDEEAPKKRYTRKESKPAKIQMTKPFGFVEDSGSNLYWMPKQIVDDPDEIAKILDRGCSDYEILE